MQKFYDLLPESIYDAKNRRFKSPAHAIALFVSTMLIQFLIGFFIDTGAFFFLSSFYFSLAIVALLTDHWIVNSVATPLWPVFIIITISGMFTAPPGFVGDYTPVMMFIATMWHGTTGLFSFIVSMRGNTSLCVMLLSTMMYSMWMYTATIWFGMYTCISPAFLCGAENQTIMVAACGIIISVLMTILNYWRGKRGMFDMKCDGWVCPL